MKDKIYKASVPLLKMVSQFKFSNCLIGFVVQKQITCNELKITSPITILNFATGMTNHFACEIMYILWKF